MIRKKDVIVIALLLAAALALYTASGLLPGTDLSEKTADVTLAPDAVEYIDDTPIPVQAEIAQPEDGVGQAPGSQSDEVRGYVVLTVADRQYGDPIAMDRDKVITLEQENGAINKVRITPEKVYMESSTCDNQDCVYQGEITPDNYQTRVLGTYIICLPNSVSIEFVAAQ